MTRLPRPQLVALTALACAIAATLLAWFVAGRQAQREAAAEFASQSELASDLLERRMERYVDVLYGLEALAHHDPELARSQFRRYVSALDLAHRFPGVRALELIERVDDSRRDAFVRRVRADRSLSPNGYPAFDIHPAGRRDEYWVVDFLEPLAGNEAAFGLDVRAVTLAAPAAERARDTGEPVVTGRLRLAQETGSSYGLVFYLPVYSGERPATPDERRASLRAFVNVVVRVDDMFTDLLTQPAMSGLGLRIHDLGTARDAEAATRSMDDVFYSTPGAPSEREPASRGQWRPENTRDIAVAGRKWRLQYLSNGVQNPWLARFPVLVLGSGACLSLMLFGILWAFARTRGEAVSIARRATNELRTQLSFTQQLLEAIPNPVYFRDPQGRYLGCNRAYEKYIGLARDELIGKTAHDVAPDDIADRSMFADRALIAKPSAEAYESSVVYAPDGKRHDVLINKATFHGPGGEVAGLVGVLVDITGRKQLEAATRESNQRLRAVIQAAPLAIIARDLKGVINMWNPAAERMFGWREDEVLGTDVSIVPGELGEQARELRIRALAGETVGPVETRRFNRAGQAIDVALAAAPIYGAEEQVIGIIATLTDITRRKQAEEALRESEANLRLAMDAAQMGMWYWECDTDRFVHSDGLHLLFGGAADDPLFDYRALREKMHAEDRELFDATLRHAIKEGADFQVDYRVVWPDGTTHWLANRGQVHRGSDGRAHRVIGVAMDITDRKLAEQRIAHMAHHDALSGLPNRVLLRDRIEQAIAQAHRNSAQLAVLFLDLDRFKTINDSLGHELGDRLLQSVASRILVCVREGDTVSRVGGDEFVIVIPGVATSADASSVASKILEVLSAAFHLNGNDLHVSVSIGISLYPADGADAETLMRNADTAMYHAKDAGRGNFQFFTQHMNVAAQQRLLLENALRRALDNDEFELHYQPLYDLRDRSVTGFEALLRWNAPDRDMVLPGEFIAAAEESGLIVPIGEWVLREALRQAKTWQGGGRALPVAVNVSANQLARPSFVARLRGLLEETGIDPALVELEVTEGVIIEGAGEARAALDLIAALGVGIAIDDFGTGYSGLAYLKRLPIDTVKIDQSFVRDLTVDPDDAAIVTAIVAMARSLGVDVVAEGVETEEQLEELKRLGCHRAQGFLLARPMNAAAVAKLLRSTPARAAR